MYFLVLVNFVVMEIHVANALISDLSITSLIDFIVTLQSIWYVKLTKWSDRLVHCSVTNLCHYVCIDVYYNKKVEARSTRDRTVLKRNNDNAHDNYIFPSIHITFYNTLQQNKLELCIIIVSPSNVLIT